MKLLIDAGNTRIKFASLAEGECLHFGTLDTRLVHRWGEQITPLQDAVTEVWVSNVAGADVAREIQTVCQSRAWPVKFIAAQAQQCGVRNGYALPAQLGCDRWAALIAAWHRCGQSALVVNCGTATTIDALSGSGEFLGGLILPGIVLMQKSLVSNTAQLQHETGQYAAFPTQTADAIVSGALQATCGAIERQYALLGDSRASILLSGGAAQMLRELLKLPVISMEDLVLQGLKIMAQEADTV